MIRVLHVVTDMNVGGIESFLMNLYRAIDSKQVQFDFLMHRAIPSYYDDEILALGGKIYRLPAIRPSSFFQYQQELTAFFLKHSDYRVIHAHNNAYSMFVLREAKKHCVPFRIAHSHCAFPKLNFVKRVTYDYCRTRINRYTTHRLACSIPAGEWLYSGAPFKVFPNAIHARKYCFNPEIRMQTRQTLALKNVFTLIHVGRFNTVKNHIFLLDVFAELLKAETNAKLLLAGDGVLRKEMEERAKRMFPEGAVQFLGIRTDIPELLQAADVFAFPSHFEGLPVTMIEAQAAGLPCVMSNTVTDECIVTDLVTALPIDDPKVWAEEILKKRGTPRTDRLAEIQAAGYDITAAAEKLTRFYLNGESL